MNESRRKALFPQVSDEDWNDWHWQVANRIETLEDLKKYISLTPEEEEGVKACLGTLRMACLLYTSKKTGEGAGQVKQRFLSAVTHRGLLAEFDTVDKLCKRVYELADSYGLAHVMLTHLLSGAVAAGHDAVACVSPMAPDRLEHLLLPGPVSYTHLDVYKRQAVIHVHVRWDDGTPTQDRERFRVVMDAIQAACPGVILIPSTGGAVGMTPEERLQPTELMPEMATLDCGTCNFGDDVFQNDMPTLRAFGKRMLENHIKPEYECFEIGHLDTALTLARKGQAPGEPRCV